MHAICVVVLVCDKIDRERIEDLMVFFIDVIADVLKVERGSGGT